MPSDISDNAISRFSQYRRLLRQMRTEGVTHIYSRQLAQNVQVTPAQVRRDMMVLGQSGNPAKGYQVGELLDRIIKLLDAPSGQNMVLVGAGNLGRALVAYFSGMESQFSLRVVAMFDIDRNKVGKVTNGKHCYELSRLPELVKEYHVDVGIITVPADAAQSVAQLMVESGIRSIMNFAPLRLELPSGIYVEYNDMSIALERAGYMARRIST